jgi:hypothetical protein
LLQDPPFVLLMFWLAAAIGWRFLVAVRVPLNEADGLEKGILATTVGLGLLQYLPLALGLSRALTPRVLLLGLLVLIALFARDMLRVGIAVVRGVVHWVKAPSRSWMLAGAILLAVPLALAFIRAMVPPGDPDGIGYHLTAPKRWLQFGDMRYLPTFAHTNAPMGVEMLYLLTMALWSDTATKLIHFGFGILAALGTFALGRRLRSPEVGFCAAALWLVGPHKENTLQYFPWAYVELGVTAQLVCAVIGWVHWYRSRSVSWLVCAGVCAGFALSYKLTGAFVGIGLALATALTLIQDRSPVRRTAGLSLLVAAISIVPALAWFVRTWSITGNPVYPMLSGVFPTRDWGAPAGQAFDLYFKYYNWGESLGRHLHLGQRALIRNVAAIVMIVGTAIWVLNWRERQMRPLVLLAGTLAVCGIMTTGLYLRFFIPLFALMYVLLVSRFAAKHVSSRFTHGLFLAFLAYRSLWLAHEAIPSLRRELAVTTGCMSRERYLTGVVSGLYATWSYANAHLPPDATILAGALHRCQGYNMGASYYCDRFCYSTEAYLQNRIRLDTWSHFIGDLKRDRIGYLVAMNTINFDQIGPDYAPAVNEFPFVQRLAHDYGVPIFSSGNFTLYRLKGLPEAK